MDRPLEFKCLMCSFICMHKNKFLCHLIRAHKHDPNFIVQCCVKGCAASYKNYNSFADHCRKKHFIMQEDVNLISGEECAANDGDCSLYSEELENEIHIKKFCDVDMSEARYVLKMKTLLNTTDHGINDILSYTKNLFESKISIENKKEDFANLFSGLETKDKQLNYFKFFFRYIQPVSVKLGSDLKNIRVRGQSKYRVVEKDIFGYIIPFQKQLETLLKMPEVIKFIDDSSSTSNQDQGDYINNHPANLHHTGSLKFMLYMDDFEIVNPIGSHRKKHKITAFYWTLLNIPPEFRSSLSAIHLLALAKKVHLDKFGVTTLLEDFILSIQKLSHGLFLPYKDDKLKKRYGFLMYVLADTPAANLLGGFKEGVGNAFRPCRVCNIKKEELPHVISEVNCELRNEDEHLDRVNFLDSQTDNDVKKNWSREWGINGHSFLADIPYFKVTQGILQDPMHLILEGVAKLEIKLMLNIFINEDKLFTLPYLNRIISSFEYSAHASTDKPEKIEKFHLKMKGQLPQTAASMIILMTSLPYIIGTKIPDDNRHWKCFLLLLQIMILSTSSIASEETFETLQYLIISHNALFIELYSSDKYTPKMHYLLHLPQQIRNFGPGRNQWCMRMEAKNGFFKRKQWHNFKNLPLSLATYHQLWMCDKMLGNSGLPSSHYLYLGDDVKKGLTVNTIDYDFLYMAFDYSQKIVLLTDEVKIKGHIYKPGVVLLYKWSCNPGFIKVKHLVIDSCKIFIWANLLKIIEYHNHLNSFEVEDLEQEILVSVDELRYVWPQLVQKNYVMLYNTDDIFD